MTLLDIFNENEKLCTEWAADLNIDIPSSLLASSHEKVWWRCEKGHEWQATVASRVYLESNCPVCSNQRIVPGINDLATLLPDLAAQWHPDFNGKLTPQNVGKGSAKKVWWRCEKGHEWQASVVSRVKSGYGCPCCVGLRVIPGETDLVTLRPDIAQQWDYERNGDIDPRNVSASSHKKVWWRCERGHSWQAKVTSRTDNNTGCPCCAGHKPIPGETDLATLNPQLAKEWHPTLNGELKPSKVGPSSSKKVWWCCEKGHEWQATVALRSNSSRGCPTCNPRRKSSKPSKTIFSYKDSNAKATKLERNV